MKRLLPLTVALAALSIAAVVLTVAVGAGGGEPSRDGAKDTVADGAGGAVAGMCIEGAPDCVDMIVNGDGDVMVGGGDVAPGECELIPDLEGCMEPPSGGQPPIRSDEGIHPDECSMVHNIDACEARAFDVAIDFNESVTQADMDLAAELVAAFDPEADFLLLETFPPIGRAMLRSNVAGFCGSVQAKFDSIPGVEGVTCRLATAPVPGSPDAPVSSTP